MNGSVGPLDQFEGGVPIEGSGRDGSFKMIGMIREDRPTAAFALSVVGLVLQVLAGVFLVYVITYYSSSYGFFRYGMMGPWMMFGGPWLFGNSFWLPFLVSVAAVELALGVLGVLWMNTANLSKIRTGSVLVLVASIIAFPTMFGFMVGSLLMLIGSILALTWQPLPQLTKNRAAA